MANFTEWLSERMRLLGHTTGSLARSTGRSSECVRGWLDGRHLPFMTLAPVLATALEVPEADVRRAIIAARDPQRAAPCHDEPVAPEVRP